MDISELTLLVFFSFSAEMADSYQCPAAKWSSIVICRLVPACGCHGCRNHRRTCYGWFYSCRQGWCNFRWIHKSVARSRTLSHHCMQVRWVIKTFKISIIAAIKNYERIVKIIFWKLKVIFGLSCFFFWILDPKNLNIDIGIYFTFLISAMTYY